MLNRNPNPKNSHHPHTHTHTYNSASSEGKWLVRFYHLIFELSHIFWPTLKKLQEHAKVKKAFTNSYWKFLSSWKLPCSGVTYITFSYVEHYHHPFPQKWKLPFFWKVISLFFEEVISLLFEEIISFLCHSFLVPHFHFAPISLFRKSFLFWRSHFFCVSLLFRKSFPF